MMVAPHESQKRTVRKFRYVMRATAGTMMNSISRVMRMAREKPMKTMPATTMKKGHTFRFNRALLLRKKNAPENRQSTAQTPKKIGDLIGVALWHVAPYDTVNTRA